MMNVEIRISGSITQRDGYCAIHTIARQEYVKMGDYDLDDAAYILGVEGKKLLEDIRYAVNAYELKQAKTEAVAA